MAFRALQLGQSAWEHDMTGSATPLGGKWQQTSTPGMSAAPHPNDCLRHGLRVP